MKAFTKTLIILICMILLGGAGTASAFLVDLNTPNELSMPIMPYATVSGELLNSSTFRFEVDLAPGLGTTLNGGSNFGLDQFFFNTDISTNLLTLTNFDPEVWDIAFNRNQAGFGRFDIKLSDPVKNDRESHLYFDIILSGPGSLMESNFFLLSDGNAGNSNGHFAAHIGGFKYGEYGSVFVRDGATAVPEPGMLLLFGSGLLGVGLFGRKKFTK